MEEFFHMFIHHEGSFVDDELTRYEDTFLELKCDVDEWSYFDLMGIFKDLEYR